MPVYEHICQKCQHEWEEFYHMDDPVPTVCPSCKEEGGVKRQISMPAGVKVELAGQEYVDSLWAEGKKLAKQARTDEKLAHNLYGNKMFR